MSRDNEQAPDTMSKSEMEELGREPFFSRLFGWILSKEDVSVEQAAGQIRDMLANAGPGTLAVSKHIFAVAILHERPMPAGQSIPKLARGFVEEYKKTGWIPSEIVVLDVAAAEAIHREDSGQMQPGESNQVLAEKLATMVKPKAVRSSSAVSFSGDNPVLGRTFFAVMAD